MKPMRIFPQLVTTLAIAFGLAVCAQAQTYTTLANFTGINGESPYYGPLVQATNGNFYGTTYNGGLQGYGVFFEVTPTGQVTNLYNFCSRPNCSDGTNPWSSPVLAADANFYGTTNLGGLPGSGTIFKMSLEGKITILYSFCGIQPCAGGQYPNGLVHASNGEFYGTTSYGGRFNGGTLFQIDSAGKFKVLYTFCSRQACIDGQNPQSAPIQASNGNFYGTTYNGGSAGTGVVYEITPTGTYNVLYNFCSQGPGCADGAYPFPALVEGGAGNLYGTTVFGGVYGSGTVFKITPTNEFSVLYSFSNTVAENPEAALILANDGSLYGTTSTSSTGHGGNVFEITLEGAYTSLHDFCNPNSSCSAGFLASGSLFQGTDGTLYGTTNVGGTFEDGTVFSLSNGLDPLVETVPVAGKIGTDIIILGNGLTGSTSVTFNGAEAAFTVESDTYIKATVPKGAITGTVSVVTPSGTLNSNPQFVVTK